MAFTLRRKAVYSFQYKRKEGARGTMRNPENVLNSLQKHSNSKDYTYNRLYRNMFNRNLFLQAYQNIYSKQVEYNVLMNEKDDEVELLKKEIERLKNEKIEKDKIIEEKDKILSKIYSENEFVKLKALHQNEKSESQKKDEMDIKEKYDKKNSLKVSAMKKSVNNTVKKVKKNFNMDDDDNVNFVKNIQNKIK